jgi:hypothetical protein
MKTFKKWVETQNKKSIAEVGPYKVEIEDGGYGKLLVTISSQQDSYAVDSKGVVKKMIDVSSLQTSPSANQGKVAITAGLVKPSMINRLEPMDNFGAGGLPSA